MEECIHHWIIPPARKSKDKGVCKKCGEEKEFINFYEEPGIKWGSAKKVKE